jgi:UDPglucose 6-dehydrogenase
MTFAPSSPIATICVVGMWHLGTVTAACLAEWEHQVIGVDPDPARISDLRHGRPPLFEPGLTALIQRNLRAGRLSFTTDLATAVRAADVVWLAFDTPIDEADEPDLGLIYEATLALAPALGPRTLLLISSQLPVGTCERLWAAVQRINPCAEGGIAYLPENLRLGAAIERFQQPDMLVIGADDPEVHRRVQRLLEPIQAPTLTVSLRTAEMVKHAINSFLATSISLANELGNLSDLLGVDGLAVAQALHLDGRIGPRASVAPGLGFAGGTLARDLRALQRVSKALNYRTSVIDAVLTVNAAQRHWPLNRLAQVIDLHSARIGLLGLTSTPHTSTLRRSAAIQLAHDLRRRGAIVKAYDPQADLTELDEPLIFEHCGDAYSAAEGCDALVIMTAWPEFQTLDFARIRELMRQPYLLDARHLLDPAQLAQLGFSYIAIGRGLTPLPAWEIQRCA